MGGPTRLPGSGKGHAALRTQVYVSEDEADTSSGMILSGGLTGAAFVPGMSYSWTHSSGGGGLNFGSGGHVKVVIEGSQQILHRDDVQEHSRPGYYTVRVSGQKYNIKCSQFEVHDAASAAPQAMAVAASPNVRAPSKQTKACVNFFPYYVVKIGKKKQVIPHSALTDGGKVKGNNYKFTYNGVKTRVKCKNVQPVRSMYKCIVQGKIVDVPFTDISAHPTSNMFNINYQGSTFAVSSASVHSGDPIPGCEGPYDHKMLFQRRRRKPARAPALKGMMAGPGGNLRLKSKRPRRKIDEQPKVEIFDVSYCLCYLIVLNGSHIVMPHHRIKASAKHTGYLRFRYNKLVYYVTPQTVHQAFYAPVVGYYACLLDNKLLVVSGMDIDKHPDPKYRGAFLIRNDNEEYTVQAPNVTFLGEFLLEPDEDNNRDGDSEGPGADRFMLGPDGNMMMIPDGAPPGGYFGPDGTYYGPDGKPYGKGTPVVMGPNGDYYKVPDGAPPGGHIDENGNYIGPDGRNYGPAKCMGGPGSIGEGPGPERFMMGPDGNMLMIPDGAPPGGYFDPNGNYIGPDGKNYGPGTPVVMGPKPPGDYYRVPEGAPPGGYIDDNGNYIGPDGKNYGRAHSVGGPGSVDQDGSGNSTSDSEASVAGRDEHIQDANDFANSTTIIRRRRITRCRRVRINGTEVVVPDDQISVCTNPKGYARVNYYGKTYFVPLKDMSSPHIDDVVGYYSVNLDGLPFIVTGCDIREHPRQPGQFIVRYKTQKYIIPKHGMLYLGDYPSGYAPDYCKNMDDYVLGPDGNYHKKPDGAPDGNGVIGPDGMYYGVPEGAPPGGHIDQYGNYIGPDGKNYGPAPGHYGAVGPAIDPDAIDDLYDDEEFWMSGDSSDSDDGELVSDEEAQMCIMVHDEYDPNNPNRNNSLPETLMAQVVPPNFITGKSVMGYRVTINGTSYTVPASKLKKDPRRPGFVEVTINGKVHRVHSDNVEPLSVPLVFFVKINRKTQVIPARFIRRDTEYPDRFVNVQFKGEEYTISIHDVTLMDGRPLGPHDLPDYNAPVYGGPGGDGPLDPSERFVDGPDGHPRKIPDGAPPGGYFDPQGNYIGPDGRNYGPGEPSVLGPDGKYYKVPEGAPPGGHVDEDGNYIGPDGRNYGPVGRPTGYGPGPERFMRGPDGNMYEIPDGAPPGGHFNPNGDYIGPDGRNYGPGNPVVLGPDGNYYAVPEGAPPGGHMDPDGNYIGPFGRNYGPVDPTPLGSSSDPRNRGSGPAVSIEYNDMGWLGGLPKGGRPGLKPVHLPGKCSKYCILHGGPKGRRNDGDSSDSDSDSDSSSRGRGRGGSSPSGSGTGNGFPDIMDQINARPSGLRPSSAMMNQSPAYNAAPNNVVLIGAGSPRGGSPYGVAQAPTPQYGVSATGSPRGGSPYAQVQVAAVPSAYGSGGNAQFVGAGAGHGHGAAAGGGHAHGAGAGAYGAGAGAHAHGGGGHQHGAGGAAAGGEYYGKQSSQVAGSADIMGAGGHGGAGGHAHGGAGGHAHGGAGGHTAGGHGAGHGAGNGGGRNDRGRGGHQHRKH